VPQKVKRDHVHAKEDGSDNDRYAEGPHEAHGMVPLNGMTSGRSVLQLTLCRASYRPTLNAVRPAPMNMAMAMATADMRSGVLGIAVLRVCTTEAIQAA
jgi:hypothetical protein